MNNAYFEIPIPINEPVKEYREGSAEKENLVNTLNKMKEKPINIPNVLIKSNFSFLVKKCPNTVELNGVVDINIAAKLL